MGFIKDDKDEDPLKYISAVDNFVDAYVRWARKFQLFRDEYHRLVALSLIGHATRNWRNRFTGNRGNRILLMIFGETGSGKTRLGFEIPYFTFTNPYGASEEDRNPLNIQNIQTFSDEALIELLATNPLGAPLIIINEAAYAFAKKYANTSIGLFNSIYDGLPYRHLIKSGTAIISRERIKASVIAITTMSQFLSIISEQQLIMDPIDSGFLARFITVEVPQFTPDQWATTINQTTSEIPYNKELTMFLRALSKIEGEVIYSDEAKAILTQIAIEQYEEPAERMIFRRKVHHIAAVAANLAISQQKATPAIVYAEHINEAIELLDALYTPCAKKLVCEIKGGVTEYDKKLMRATQRVAEYIYRKGVVRRSELIKNMSMPARRLDEIEQNLKEFGIRVVFLGRTKAYCARESCEGCPFKERCHKYLT